MRVLLTGGAGFIGSHIADACVERGWDVTIVDDLSTGRRENLNSRARFIEGDLTDPAIVQSLFDGKEFDVVNHHAAQIDVRKSVADPAWDAEQNIVASLRLFEAAASSGVKRIVFASSGGAAYGEPQYAPQDENHPFAPLSPYGCAKLAVEHYLGFYRHVRGMRAVALRYGNVYGPRQNPHGEAGVIAIFAGRMARGETVTINGDGAQTRDYVHVRDVVRANVAVMDSDLDGAFNVGTGIETSVSELYEMMRSQLTDAPAAVHGPAKAGEQLRSVLDGSRLRDAARLPTPIPLEEGLRDTIAFLTA